MLDINEIKKEFCNISIDFLTTNYTERQKRNIMANEKAISYILEDFSMFESYYKNLKSNIEKFRTLTILIMNCDNSNLKNILINALNHYNYQYQSELLMAIQLADSLLTKELDWKLFFTSLKGLITIKDCQQQDGILKLQSTLGDVKLIEASKYLGIKNDDPTNRQRFCHDITSNIICNFPHLIGAYYYIPLQFTGYIEHSVVLDLENNMVLDFANNIAIPLDFFKKFYPQNSFTIKGADFRNLKEQIEDLYGKSINMAHIEEIRRTRNKK